MTLIGLLGRYLGKKLVESGKPVELAVPAGITKDSVVLDLGCGLGINSVWLAETFACHVVGLDISGEMINYCTTELLEKKPHYKSLKMTFVKGTMDEKRDELRSLKITHMFSTGTIYQIHRAERFKLWNQLAGIMEPGGVLVFDDAVCPNGVVKCPAAKAGVYDRLHLEALESAGEYEKTLAKAGFKLEYSEDMSAHQGKSYVHLSHKAKAAGYEKLGSDYDISVKACAEGDFGWHLFVAKLAGSSSISGMGTSPEANQKLYDDWAAQYTQDVRS